VRPPAPTTVPESEPVQCCYTTRHLSVGTKARRYSASPQEKDSIDVLFISPLRALDTYPAACGFLPGPRLGTSQLPARVAATEGSIGLKGLKERYSVEPARGLVSGF